MMSWQKENFRRLNRTGGCQLKDFPLLNSNFHLDLFEKIVRWRCLWGRHFFFFRQRHINQGRETLELYEVINSL
jgi:hypothetical protein